MGPMNYNWYTELYKLCNNDPFQRKTLIADHFGQAEQWLSRMVRECGPLLGVETETIRSIVIKRTKLELVKQGQQLLTSDQTFWIIQNLMLGLVGHFENYMAKQMVTSGIVHSFHHAIEELRCAGIEATKLSVSHFDSQSKGLYIIELLTLYEQWLDLNHYTDFAGLLRYLPSPAETDNNLLIIRSLEHLSPVEKEMLKRIAGSELVILRQEASFPASLENKSEHNVRYYRAAGSIAEVRETFRQICRQDIPFDQAEIMVSDYESYVTAIYTLSQTLQIPCTFSKGLATSYTKVGKAALLYLQWLESNYDMNCLLGALRHNYIHFRYFGDSVDTDDLILTLEKSGIGWGKDRYTMLAVAATEEKKGNIEATQLLHRVFKELFQILPDSLDETWSPLIVLCALIDFLEKCLMVSSDADLQFIGELKSQAKLLGTVSPTTISREIAIRYVKDIVNNIRINREGPRYGKLHISSLHDGGESGREHTYILGMSDAAWSVKLHQDPVLLDDERRRLGSLQLSTEKAEYMAHDRNTRLGSLSGTVTLSFANYDPADQKECYPAFELLQVVRIMQSDPYLDLSRLEHILGKQIGYITEGYTDGEQHLLLDGTDRWLRRLVKNGKIQNGLPSLAQAFSFSGGNEIVKTTISKAVLSEYEGILTNDIFSVRYRNNPEMYLSVTQLERYAECPKKFFISSILKVRQKDTSVFNRAEWLNAADRGSLLHRIYHLYLQEMAQGTAANNSLVHHEQRLKDITEQVLREYEVMVPPPSVHIFRKETEAIRQDVAIFYKMERSRQGQPRYFELELTKDGKPMNVILEDGLELRMKGFVDRVDEIAPHLYKIYDYKTGRHSKYDENEYFSQGTQLQHALYAVAVEQWLQQTGVDMEARVVESAYYFPTERGKGEEVSRIQNKRAELSQLVGHLLDSMESGSFSATTESKRCSWCEYSKVCGNESDLIQQKWLHPDNDQLLRHRKEVERFV